MTGVLVLGCGVAGWLGDRPLADVVAVRRVVQWRALERAGCGGWLCWLCCVVAGGVRCGCVVQAMESCCALRVPWGGADAGGCWALCCSGARVLCCGCAGMRSEGAIGAEPSAVPGHVAGGAGLGSEPGPDS